MRLRDRRRQAGTCGGSDGEQNAVVGHHRLPGEVGRMVQPVPQRHGAPVAGLHRQARRRAQEQQVGGQLQGQRDHPGLDQHLAPVPLVDRVRQGPDERAQVAALEGQGQSAAGAGRQDVGERGGATQLRAVHLQLHPHEPRQPIGHFQPLGAH